MTLPRLLLLLACALAALPRGARAADATFLIVNPSGRGNQALAEGFLGDFAAALGATWPKGAPAPSFTGRYHVTSVDAVASVKRSQPLFALVSPGFYLEHRERLGLVPLLQPVRAHEGPPVVHLVIRAGAPPKDPATMKLGGQLAGEPAWVMGPVLGLPDGARPAFLPSARSLEAVRQLEAGTVDGILLPDADWALLQATKKATGLAIARTSPPLPEGPVVTFGEPTPEALQAVEAMLGFPQAEAGRKALDRMGLRGFARASATDYARFQSAHDRALAALSR